MGLILVTRSSPILRIYSLLKAEFDLMSPSSGIHSGPSISPWYRAFVSSKASSRLRRSVKGAGPSTDTSRLYDETSMIRVKH